MLVRAGVRLDRELVDPACEPKASGAVAKEQFYLTTAINYTNGAPHMGHAYEAVTSDVISRYHRTFGRDVFFLTGADEHGQKVEQSAIKDGVTPQAIADRYSSGFRALNDLLEISNNSYIRTTMAHHKELAQKIWCKVRERGDIYLKDYVGWYNVHEECYVTDADAEADNFQDENGRPYEKKSEESYFFRMGKYKDALLKYITEENPGFIQPESRKQEVLKFLEGELQDLCISRTVCQWGVPCPPDPSYKGDKNHVMYVWFDALTNYLSGVNYLRDAKDDPNNWQRFWPASVHIIGKDIIRFHCVIWPSMLLSAGVPLPQTVFGHGFVLDKDGRKMSKSLGNVIDPVKLLELYPSDSIRFYIARSSTYGLDLAFSETAMCALHNSILKDAMGNLVHRATSLCRSLNGGLIPDEEPALTTEGKTPFDLELLRATFELAFSARPEALAFPALEADATTKEALAQARRNGGFQIQVAAEALARAMDAGNVYLQTKQPWTIKGKDAEAVAKKGGIIRMAFEAIYILAHFLEPFCPHAAAEIFHKVGVKPTKIAALRATFDNLRPGAQTYVGAILFEELAAGKGAVKPTIGKDKGEIKQNLEKAKAAKLAKQKAARKHQQEASNAPLVSKIEFRVGKITKAWEHENSDHLWCETIDVGEEEPRQVASGLRAHYSQEDLEGRMVVVCCNLPKKPLGGFASHGMVICATKDGKVEILDPPAGAKIGERLGLKDTDPNEFDPEPEKRVARKKIFAAVAAELKTGAACEATWSGKQLVTSAGPCTVKTLTDAPLS